jgi:gamma-glutamylcyclotransferase (GGCT)/AIG2-like uncharacterized protein YtfP
MMQRLFIYGSLQPGGPNEHLMNEIGGDWEQAVAKGHLIKDGWGSKMGYPGLVLDEFGEDVHGHVFRSLNLESEWAKLDKFEGEDYQRVTTNVTLVSGEQVEVQVYTLRANEIPL